jgi:hypothetical protein
MRLILVAVIASVAASAEYGRFEGSGKCASACVERQEFCGTDNQCYRYGCTNWYRYGPPEFTGHDDLPELERRSQNLNCQDVDATTDKNGIIYGCGGYIDSPPPDGEGFAQGLTRECMAQNLDNQFVCYEMADNVDFEPFRKRAMNCEAGGTGCYGVGYGTGSGMGYGTGSGMGSGGLMCRNQSQTPRFIYQIYLECPGFAASIGSESEEFNETLAQTTMYSYLEDISQAPVQKFQLLGLHFLAVATVLWALV